MGGHTLLEIPCTICANPVDLSVELCADEQGKAVHEDCYVKHIADSRNDQPSTVMAN
jgi:hypothetical protein